MAPRSLKVKCPTWDHVEAFYQRKLRDGNRLRMKVPFVAERGDEITVALRLPNQLVMAIDASVVGVEPHPHGSAINMLLHGMTPQVLGRLEALVADGRSERPIARPEPSEPPPLPTTRVPQRPATEPPPPQPPDAPVDELVVLPPEVDAQQLADFERDVFVELEATLRRLRERGAHEVLGVPWDASVQAIRSSYFELTKRFHPDIFAVYRSRAIQYLAQEVFIHINRAYDRMRDAAVSAGHAIVAGPALLPQQGWLAELDDIQTLDNVPRPALEAEPTGSQVRFAAATDEPLFSEPSPAPAPSMDQDQVEGKVRRAAELEEQAAERLDAGDWEGACEALASALQLDPRNRRLRGLYHTARGKKLLAEGSTLQATSQFEAAVVHDPGCEPARVELDALRAKHPKRGLFKGFHR